MALSTKMLSTRITHSGCSRLAVVYIGKLALILASCHLMRLLHAGRLYMVFIHGSSFCLGRLGSDTSGAIETCMIYCMIDDSIIDIGVVNDSRIYS
jgi:hypothetical protein